MRFFPVLAVAVQADPTRFLTQSSIPTPLHAQPALVETPISPHNAHKIDLARQDEVSFLQSTLKSMESNQEAVLRSNQALDQQVAEGAEKLSKITDEVDRLDADAESKISNLPFSLLEVGSIFDTQSGVFGRKPSHADPLAIARERAAASEKKFEQAMQKLEADKQALLKDESFRRARALQERHHLHI